MAVTGERSKLFTPNLVYSKTISSGKPLPKFVSEECLNAKVSPVVIRVSIIDCLRYLFVNFSENI